MANANTERLKGQTRRTRVSDRKDGIRELLDSKVKAEKEIDDIWAEDEKERKRLEQMKGEMVALGYLGLASGSMARMQSVEAIRKKVARINDELIVNLLDSIDSHSNRLEWLTYALIGTSSP